MIIKEFYLTRPDGVNLYRTYSDQNFMIHKIGTEEYYSEAIDVESATFIYEETDRLIEEPEAGNDSEAEMLKAKIADMEAALAVLGVEE